MDFYPWPCLVCPFVLGLSAISWLFSGVFGVKWSLSATFFALLQTRRTAFGIAWINKTPFLLYIFHDLLTIRHQMNYANKRLAYCQARPSFEWWQWKNLFFLSLSAQITRYVTTWRIILLVNYGACVCNSLTGCSPKHCSSIQSSTTSEFRRIPFPFTPLLLFFFIFDWLCRQFLMSPSKCVFKNFRFFIELRSFSFAVCCDEIGQTSAEGHR